MVMLKNPESPATKSQLWLLHILTKTDTRNLNITMQEASNRIESLKSGKSTVKTIKPENKPIATNKIMLGTIEITKAYKQISSHHWEGKPGFCIDVTIVGIFPRGKKAHELYWYISGDRVLIHPQYAHIQNDVEIPLKDMQEFILSITDIRYFTPSPIPDDVKPIAEAKAKILDSNIELYHLVNGEYIDD